MLIFDVKYRMELLPWNSQDGLTLPVAIQNQAYIHARKQEFQTLIMEDEEQY